MNDGFAIGVIAIGEKMRMRGKREEGGGGESEREGGKERERQE